MIQADLAGAPFLSNGTRSQNSWYSNSMTKRPKDLITGRPDLQKSQANQINR